jgi:hypothetical protein
MADDAQPSSDKPVEQEAQAPTAPIDRPQISPAERLDDVTAPAVALAGNKASQSRLAPDRARLALLTASFFGVAAFSSVLGAFAMNLTERDPPGQQERIAVQESLMRLTQDVASMKLDLASSEKTTRAQTARIADLEASLKAKLAREQSVVTGTVPSPLATAGRAPGPAPLPPAKPQIESKPARDTILEGWRVLGVRRGFAFVRSGDEMYRVTSGDRLPGLGTVEEVRRDDSGWVVVTNRGLIIASRRDRF